MEKRMKEGRKKQSGKLTAWLLFAVLCLLLCLFFALLFSMVPSTSTRYLLSGIVGMMILILLLWAVFLRRQVIFFAEDLNQTLDTLMAGNDRPFVFPYEDSLNAKVEERLLRFYEVMREGKEESLRDKETIQSMVSDISHQVKTPIANMKMFTSILQQEMEPEKKAEFFVLMEGQVDKLDFLMQSLIKMSRLETGTFILHPVSQPVYDTIAMAVGGVFAKAEEKEITLSVECDSGILVRHDRKWTAEALFNILDNAVKYTEAGGSVTVSVRPWQFYTRIDISDTGVGLQEEEYHKIFKRFYRSAQAANKEGVGLGLYLAQRIVERQRGFISVKSVLGSGTVFSVYLLI